MIHIIILQHINTLAGEIDLQKALSRAEFIVLRLQSREHLPSDIEELVRYPPPPCDTTSSDDEHTVTEPLEELNQDDEDVTSDKQCSSASTRDDDVSMIRGDSVVELKENSESIFQPSYP